MLRRRRRSAPQTLHQVYENKTGLATVLYNDEPPGSAAPSNASRRVRAGDGSTSIETAHAKGILAYDGADAGFFLIHSVPKVGPHQSFLSFWGWEGCGGGGLRRAPFGVRLGSLRLLY